MKKLLFLVLVLTLLVPSSGCLFDPNDATVLQDLPLPANIKNITIISQQKVGNTEAVDVVCPGIEVVYKKLGVGIESEKVVTNGMTATLAKYSWSDEWLGGKITNCTDYDLNGEIVDARIILEVPDVSIIGMFIQPRYIVDRSQLTLQFLPDSTGSLVLSNAFYYEKYGTKDNDTVCFGITAAWYDLDKMPIFGRFQQWGFWETTETPFKIVVDALDIARKNLNKDNADYLAYDKDSFREVIGEQSGTDIVVNGNSYCKVEYEYDNITGRMPNTKCVKGSLVAIRWRFSDGQYKSLIIKSSQMTSRPSALLIYCQSQEEENRIINLKWLDLYHNATKNYMVIYSAGQVGKITTSTSEETVNIGEGGGVLYGFIHQMPDVNKIIELRQLLDMIGLPGIKAIGFYYPTKENSGNGIHYFLSIMAVRETSNLSKFNLGDIGLLDRVGMPVADPLKTETFNGIYEGSGNN